MAVRSLGAATSVDKDAIKVEQSRPMRTMGPKRDRAMMMVLDERRSSGDATRSYQNAALIARAIAQKEECDAFPWQ